LQGSLSLTSPERGGLCLDRALSLAGSNSKAVNPGGEITLGDLALKTRDEIVARTRPSSHACTGSLCKYWVAKWGGRALNEITSLEVVAWATTRKQEKAEATVVRELSFLRQIFRTATRLKIAHQFPCTDHGVRFKKLRRHQWLTYEEQPQLIAGYQATLPDTWQLEWSLADFVLLSGLRRGEQMHLRAEHLDERFIRVPQEGKCGGRLVPMHPRAWEISLQWIRRARDINSEWVFWPEVTRNRLKYGERYALKVWYPAVDASGLPRLQWRDLRRSYASRLLEQDVPVLEVKELLGHTSVEQTLTYCQIQPNKLRRSVLRLS